MTQMDRFAWMTLEEMRGCIVEAQLQLVQRLVRAVRPS